MAYIHRRFEYTEDGHRLHSDDLWCKVSDDLWYKVIIDMHYDWDADEMLTSWIEDGWGNGYEGITMADVFAADALGIPRDEYILLRKQCIKECLP